MRPLQLVLLMWFFLSSAWAGELFRPAKTGIPPVIDGIFGEAEWSAALIVSDFVQRLPVEGALPSEQTEFRFLYSETSLYIGMRAYDSHPDKIVADVMRRDDFDITQNDQIAIAIDSYNDGRNGYWFSTNPLGVRVDAQFSNEGDIFETNWDGSWHCSARTDSRGWTAEIEIPFSTLRFPDEKSHVMGINLYRRIIRTNEGLFAPLIPLRLQNGTPNVSVARKYLFEGISGGKKILIKPYLLGGIQNQDLLGSTPQRTETDIGLDLRYNVTNNLAASLSINTDFAETEVDEQQINLTRFSLFFPEKRDFFLENAGNFLLGVPQEADLFFSRRIGLNENADGTFLPVAILLGAKVTGKLAGVDLGILHVRTKAEDDIAAKNSSAIRLKAGVTPRSYIGAIFAANEQKGSFDLTGGADWNIYFLRDVAFTGFAATNKNSADALNADSSSFYLAAVKGGELTSFSVGWLKIGSDFDPDLGFIKRPGTTRYDAALKAPLYVQSKRVRRVVPGFTSLFYDNDRGQLENSFQRFFINIDLQSDDIISLFVERNSENLAQEFLIFDPVILPPGQYDWYEAGAQLTTKPGRKVFSVLTFKNGGFYNGNHYELGSEVGWKLNRHLSFSGAYFTNASKLESGSFRTHLMRSKVNYSFNTSFSIDVLSQYDNHSRQLGANLRANYILREGTELIFVYNEIMYVSKSMLKDQHGAFRSALLKFTYLWQF